MSFVTGKIQQNCSCNHNSKVTRHKKNCVDRCYIGQIYNGDWAKICGLLRINELYPKLSKKLTIILGRHCLWTTPNLKFKSWTESIFIRPGNANLACSLVILLIQITCQINSTVSFTQMMCTILLNYWDAEFKGQADGFMDVWKLKKK